MAPNKWARVAKAEAHGLRRGAWYPVVNDTTDSMVVLDVNKENRPVSRAWLQFRDQRPTKWSVVRRDPEDLPAKKASRKELGPIYGVCPRCRQRTTLQPEDVLLACAECGSEYEVDWANPC